MSFSKKAEAKRVRQEQSGIGAQDFTLTSCRQCPGNQHLLRVQPEQDVVLTVLCYLLLQQQVAGVLLVMLVQHLRYPWFRQDFVVYLFQMKDSELKMLSFKNGEIIMPPLSGEFFFCFTYASVLFCPRPAVLGPSTASAKKGHGFPWLEGQDRAGWLHESQALT